MTRSTPPGSRRARSARLRTGLLGALVVATTWSASGPTTARAQDDVPATVLVAPTATTPGLETRPVTDDRTGIALPCPIPVAAGATGPRGPLDEDVVPVASEPLAGSTDCGDPTRSDDRALVLSFEAAGRADRGRGALRPGVLAGIVPAGAARVVLRTTHDATQVLPVVATRPYRGPLAGRIAFVLATATVPVGEVTEARVERADGSLLGITGDLSDPVPSSFPLLSSGGVLLGAPIVRRVPTARGTVTFTTEVTSTLVPSAAALERRRLGACTTGALGDRPFDEVGVCDAEDLPTTPSVTGGLECDARRVVLTGTLPAGRAGGTALLTDGRRVALSVTPPLVGGRRAWTFVAPAGVGVRRLVDVPDPGGSGLSVPPASVGCALADGEELAAPRPTLRDDARQATVLAAAVPGTPASLASTSAGVPLLGLDGPGGTLCLGLGRAPVVSGCAVLGRGPDAEPLVISRALPGGRVLVAGVSSPAETRVRVRLSPRGALSVATAVPTGDYDGAYADGVRTFSALLPAGRTVADVRGVASGRLAAAAADVLGPDAPFGGADDEDRPLASRPLARTVAGLRVWAGRDERGCAVAVPRSQRAVRLTELSCAGGHYLTLATVTTPCAARRTVVTVPMVGRSARLEVTDDRGRVRTGRRVQLTRGIALHVVTLPRTRALRSLRTSGADGPPLRTTAAHAPSAAAQCGWSAGALAARPSPGDS